MRTAEFEMARETIGTPRYEESVGNQPTIVGTLYIKKYAVGREPPKKIRVTIETA